MTASRQKLNLAPEGLRFRGLVRRWAEESNVDPSFLALRLLQLLSEGRFDDLPPWKGILVYDPETGRLVATAADRLRAELKEGWRFDLWLDGIVRNDFLALHRDAVAVAARDLGIAAPSWWRIQEPSVESGASRTRRGRRPGVGPKIEAAMREMDRRELAAMKQEEMAAHFRASRDTCQRMRDKVLQG